MQASGVQALLRFLLEADVEHADRDQVAGLVGDVRRLRGWVDGFEVRCVRRADELATRGRSESSESMIGAVGNCSSRDARLARLRADACDRFVLFERAMANGTIAAGHVDALALAIRDLNDDQHSGIVDREERLVTAAGRMRVDEFARFIRIQVADVVGALNAIAVQEAAAVARNDADAHADTDSGVECDPTGDAAGAALVDPEVAAYERQRAGSKLRRWTDVDTGLCMTLIALDPLRDAAFRSAFNLHLNRLRATGSTSGQSWSEVEVDAMMQLIAASTTTRRATASTTARTDGTGSGGTRSGGTGAGGTGCADHGDERAVGVDSGNNVPEVCVVITLDQLLADATGGGLCETSDGTFVTPVSLRRMLCDAAVYPVVLGGDGEVLDAGRTSRTVNRKQRRALRAMHRTCGEPGCTVPFESCRIHHVTWWHRDHGPTDLANLLPLCERHHHLVHEGGWRLTMTPDRVATWTRPDGTHYHTGSTVDRGNHSVALAAEHRQGPGG